MTSYVTCFPLSRPLSVLFSSAHASQENKEWSATYKAMVYQATEDAAAFAEELARREKKHAAVLAEREATLTAEHAEAAEAAAEQTAALANRLERAERRVANLVEALERAGAEAEAEAAAAAEQAQADAARLLAEQAEAHAIAAAEMANKERVQRAEALDEVRMRLGAVKQALDVTAAAAHRSHAVNRLSQSVFALSAAAAAGQPLAEELGQVRAAAAGLTGAPGETDVLVDAVLAGVSAEAAKAGVPTEAALGDRLSDVNRAARALVLVPRGGGGVLAHAAAAAAAWFRVGERQRGGMANEGATRGGEGVEAALAAAAAAMSEGRMAEAADAVEAGVAGTAAAAAVEGWVADARERQRLELALSVLRSHASAVASSLS